MRHKPFRRNNFDYLQIACCNVPVRTVYIDGGSTAYGMFDKEQGGWPNRLHVAALCEEKNFEDMPLVQSRAFPGRTLPGIFARGRRTHEIFQAIRTCNSSLAGGHE